MAEVSTALDNARSSNKQAAKDAKQFRRSLNKQPTYTRRTNDDEASLQAMEQDGVGYSRSGLVAQVPTPLLKHLMALQCRADQTRRFASASHRTAHWWQQRHVTFALCRAPYQCISGHSDGCASSRGACKPRAALPAALQSMCLGRPGWAHAVMLRVTTCGVDLQRRLCTIP